MIYPRILLINVLSNAVAGLLVLAGVWTFGGAEFERLTAWIWQGAAILVGGITIQAVIHMRWLQAEELLAMPGRVAEDRWLSRSLRHLLYFPFRSVFLALFLWLVLGAVAAWLWGRETATGAGIGLSVYVMMLAIGGCAALIQNFLYRGQIYPAVESFMERLPDGGQRWVRSRTLPFTLRAKLLIQGLFSLTIVFLVMTASGYAIEYRTLRERKAEHQALMLRQLGTVWDRAQAQRDPGYAAELLGTFGRVLQGGVALVDRSGGRRHVWMPPEANELGRWLDYRLQGSNRQTPYVLATSVRMGDLTIAAASRWDDLGGPLGGFVATFGMAMLTAWGLILAVAALAAREFSRSVRRVERWAEALGAGALEAAPRVPEDDELADLTIRLETMRSRLHGLLGQLERGTVGTRSLSGRVQEHAMLLRQTTEEDVKLVGLVGALLGRLENTLRDHQKAAGVLAQAAEDTVSGSAEMSMILKEMESSGLRLRESVAGYGGALEAVQHHVAAAREHLRIFLRGIDEGRRGLVRLEDTLDALVESISRARLVVVRVGDQNIDTADVLQRAFLEVTQLQESMLDSARMIEHLYATMAELEQVARGIHDVAEDTKLLSLNAAIRSVKAHDDGLSFAVISRTIQGLAVATQEAVGTLVDEIRQLMMQSGALDHHVGELIRNLRAAVGEAGEGAATWRQARSSLQDLRILVDRFDLFVQELRNLRDNVRTRQTAVDAQAQIVARILGNLAAGLDQRRQQLDEVDVRAGQIRDFGAHQVQKGRHVSDQIEQVREMSTHVHGFVVEQLRNLRELEQQFGGLQDGMTLHAHEAREISEHLQGLERAIRRFQEAFSRFRLQRSVS